MSKLYVPDGAWLVCSKGMKKQQIKVTSQSSVTIAGGYLKATIDDRPGGNFMCGNMVIGGAVLGAVVAVFLVAGSIVTGGALAVAAGAAIGAGVGFLGTTIPSICGMLLKNWNPYDKDVLTVGKHPLLENSTIPCWLGGNVMILYSEKAADEFTDINIGKTIVNTAGIIALAYISYPAIVAIWSTVVTAKSIFVTFGCKAGANYLGGIFLSAGTAYGIQWGTDQVKGEAYSMIPTGDGKTVKTYVDGFESDPDKITKDYQIANSNGDKSIADHINEIGGAIGVGKETIGDRTSKYSVTERTRFVRLDDIEEIGPTTYNEIGKIQESIDGRKPKTNSDLNILDQDYGGRYQEVERVSTTTNSQYSKNDLSIKGASNTVKNSTLGALKDNFGKPSFDPTKGGVKGGIQGGGFYLGLLQDTYKGITNFILKGQAEDLIESLKKEEAEARAKITVIAGKD